MLTRRSGILLHPTSLPGPFGIGELGRHAHAWVDTLADAGQRAWQVMPLGPTGFGDSPYQCFSAFAGNPYLISLERLQGEGLLSDDDLAEGHDLPGDRVDYGRVIAFKLDMLRRAEARFEAGAPPAERAARDAFTREQADWLDDYAAFMALKQAHDGQPWNAWDPALRDREPGALADALAQHADEIRRQSTWQYWVRRDWMAVRRHAGERGIAVIGDIPIFVAYDSADTWAQRDAFFLDEQGAPTVVAGVPPDYFSDTGQRWGNPLYRWEAMADAGFPWWIRRFRATLDYFDLIRVDHFRGFEAYWEIPAREPTAVNGRWVQGPGQPLFDALRDALGELPILAEDLGVITPGVEELRDANGFPGMKVLQFAFAAGASDPYLPHNYPRNCLVYTGTHDNDTTRGWYAAAPEAERDHVRRYLGRADHEAPFELIRAAQASVADLAVFPLQDALGLGSEARMNTPGRAEGNWSWRFAWEQLPAELVARLRDMATLYGRTETGAPRDTPYRQTTTGGGTDEEAKR
ncbi:MAG: 4-alpha-glucanotransferase [Trueperaceae bacterium]|nr:4-alpha-glucanotransferase [Trueperaceae bacterium]